MSRLNMEREKNRERPANIGTVGDPDDNAIGRRFPDLFTELTVAAVGRGGNRFPTSWVPQKKK